MPDKRQRVAAGAVDGSSRHQYITPLEDFLKLLGCFAVEAVNIKQLHGILVYSGIEYIA